MTWGSPKALARVRRKWSRFEKGEESKRWYHCMEESKPRCSTVSTGILQTTAYMGMAMLSAQCPATEEGDLPGVGGTYPSQPALGLFSLYLVQK